MGLIRGIVFDTTILVASERKRESVEELIERMQSIYGEVEAAISTVSLVELTHGIYRARTDEDRKRRRLFVEEIQLALALQSLSVEIAQLAGRIEGEQAARGFIVPFEDLIIGCTALYLGFDVATLNVRHFQLIPDLNVISI